MTSTEFGPNGAAISKSDGVASIKRELRRNEHAFSDGKTRRMDGLGAVTRGALMAFVGVSLAQTAIVAVYYFYPSILPGIFFEWGEDGFNAGYLFDIAYMIVAVATFFIVCKFTYRAMKNLFTVASPHAQMSPGWTIGWYFVPVASLWQPVMGMSQIYNGSYEAVGEKAPGSPIGIWWGCWLLMNVPEWIASAWAGDIVVQFVLITVTAALGIGAALSLRTIVGRVTACQSLFERGGVATVFE